MKATYGLTASSMLKKPSSSSISDSSESSVSSMSSFTGGFSHISLKRAPWEMVLASGVCSRWGKYYVPLQPAFLCTQSLRPTRPLVFISVDKATNKLRSAYHHPVLPDSNISSRLRRRLPPPRQVFLPEPYVLGNCERNVNLKKSSNKHTGHRLRQPLENIEGTTNNTTPTHSESFRYKGSFDPQ